MDRGIAATLCSSGKINMPLFEWQEQYATRERDIRKLRLSDPGCSDIWILRAF